MPVDLGAYKQILEPHQVDSTIKYLFRGVDKFFGGGRTKGFCECRPRLMGLFERREKCLVAVLVEFLPKTFSDDRGLAELGGIDKGYKFLILRHLTTIFLLAISRKSL